MSENNNKTIKMEDISSTSKSYQVIDNINNTVSAYTNGIYKNLGNIIKAIAFVIAFALIIVGFIAAFILFTKSIFSAVTSLAVIILCTVVAAIVFFPIFGIGHILCQNNEILKLLNK